MLRYVLRFSTVVAVTLLLCGCGWLPWVAKRRRAAADKMVAESRRAALVVGRVSLVNEGERFALIEADLVQPPPAGTVLRIYSGSALSAELRATGVRRRPFMVADLVSGMPAKGDLVVQPVGGETPAPRATAVTPAATPEAASAPVAKPLWKRWLGFFGGRK